MILERLVNCREKNRLKKGKHVRTPLRSADDENLYFASAGENASEETIIHAVSEDGEVVTKAFFFVEDEFEEMDNIEQISLLDIVREAGAPLLSSPVSADYLEHGRQTPALLLNLKHQDTAVLLFYKQDGESPAYIEEVPASKVVVRKVFVLELYPHLLR